MRQKPIAFLFLPGRITGTYDEIEVATPAATYVLTALVISSTLLTVYICNGEDQGTNPPSWRPQKLETAIYY